MMPLHSAIASASRSALMSGMRTIASQTTIISRTLAPKHVPISPFSSSTRTLPRAASRIVGALGMVESMMPLHSAIASARLKSSIAVDSACWPTLVDEGDEWWRTVGDDGNYGCVVPFNIGSNGWDRIGGGFKKPVEKT
ncbi:unnamed protein product [Lactuca virosa]|uniref:Chlorophyll a-b binding protein, chloroplastic n=1 Tax=Lactuca virosa TaxID=75947 RepID=A0AAU9MWV8_9ASTR|nr:unnamed protein product [Lactuca virosa]